MTTATTAAARALLCHVAHHALHGRFRARDLLLMSHLQEVAHDADIETQILANRAMVLLGYAPSAAWSTAPLSGGNSF